MWGDVLEVERVRGDAYHSDDGARGQERDQSIEEGLSLVLGVVLLSDLFLGLAQGKVHCGKGGMK